MNHNSNNAFVGAVGAAFISVFSIALMAVYLGITGRIAYEVFLWGWNLLG